MPFWQRLVITLVAMIAASFIIGLIWNALFGFPLPSYLGGMIGGLTALPIWEFLRAHRPQAVQAGRQLTSRCSPRIPEAAPIRSGSTAIRPTMRR